jgi:hypothetical protein
MRRILAPCAIFATTVGLYACATYSQDLNRGHRHFAANEYEHALAIWRVLEPDINSLSAQDRARYAYLRGMTDYRLSFRSDARHWLALARAYDQATPGGLEDPWKERMKEALKDLENDLLGTGEPSPAGDAPTATTLPPAVPGDVK